MPTHVAIVELSAECGDCSWCMWLMCYRSRHSLMTGRYPHTSGMSVSCNIALSPFVNFTLGRNHTVHTIGMPHCHTETMPRDRGIVYSITKSAEFFFICMLIFSKQFPNSAPSTVRNVFFSKRIKQQITNCSHSDPELIYHGNVRENLHCEARCPIH